MAQQQTVRESEIAWLLPDGSGGFTTKEGMVSIPGTVPGDRVQWTPIDTRGRRSTARVDTWIKQSPHRISPTCIYNADCGGCDLSSLAADIRRSELARIAQRAFGLPSPPTMIYEDVPQGRSRITLTIEQGQVGYRAAASHRHVPIVHCRIARHEIQQVFPQINEWASTQQGITSLELRSNGAKVVANLRSNDAHKRDLKVDFPLPDFAINGQRGGGDPVLSLELLGHTLRCSPASFFQVNLALNAELVAYVRGVVQEMKPERILELYAGIGNFTVPLAANGHSIVAVELEGQAVADLRVNVANRPVTVVGVPVERFDPSTTAFDVLLLDPPRTGAPGMLERAIRNRPRAIVYVACDAPAAARDLKPVLAAGYRVTEVRCFDLFPETRHFESVIVLRR